jgi:hypothetical protein
MTPSTKRSAILDFSRRKSKHFHRASACRWPARGVHAASPFANPQVNRFTAASLDAEAA